MGKKNKTKQARAEVTAQKYFAVRLSKVNNVINRFEKEVEKAVKRVTAQGKKSSESVIKIFDEVVSSLGANDLRSKAIEKKDEVISEIRRLSDEIVDSIREFEFNFDASFFNRVRQILLDSVRTLQNSEILEIAKGKVTDGKNQIFSYLQIASQAEVDSLSRKVISLEKKLKVVSKQSGQAAA